MVKKKMRKFFGGRITIWDFIVVGLVIPYFYLVFAGISYESGILAIYSEILAPSLVFTFVVAHIVNFLAKKSRT